MIAPFPAAAPSDDVAFVAQFAGMGTLIGTAVAARRHARDPSTVAWLLVARWTIAGAAVGLLVAIAMRVL
jgi:hypothetical protein